MKKKVFETHTDEKNAVKNLIFDKNIVNYNRRKKIACLLNKAK